jgi:autophagy-related protein 11
VSKPSHGGSSLYTFINAGAGAVESEGIQEPDFKEGLLGGEDITGTSNLEVENAWLKSELAAAVAMLCNLDPDFELNDELGADAEFVDGGERPEGVNPAAARKTAEALKLKDDHAKHLHEIIVKQEVSIISLLI